MTLQLLRSDEARRYVLFAVTVACASAIAFAAGAVFHPGPNNSPHASALEFLLSEDIATIGKLEKDHDAWWFDTKPRQWTVRRPFAPGVVDTTHLFVVVYFIGGKEVAQWNVNTDRQEITRVKGPGVDLKEGPK